MKLIFVGNFVCNLCRKTAALDFFFFNGSEWSQVQEGPWTGELTDCSDQMCYSFATILRTREILSMSAVPLRLPAGNIV